MPRSGSADLPLHGGRVPEWLASRMSWCSGSGITSGAVTARGEGEEAAPRVLEAWRGDPKKLHTLAGVIKLDGEGPRPRRSTRSTT